MSAPAAAQESPRWTIVIHGGAGVIERDKMTPEREAAARAGLNAALDAGSKVLDAGGSALDAVEAAVRVLEDDPNFNAGRGAVFTYEGTNELDAAIMDGATRAAGAVAGVTATKNPIGLARRVMEASPHVMLAGKGADTFSREQGLEQAGPEWFATDERRQQLEKMKAQKTSWFDVDMKYGTVGAVARDAQGHVAAATSTGGVTGKRWGRVGDSPLIGAGTYADDRACAVSATGAGEFFIREGVAHEICARVRFAGDTLKQAADTVMAETRALGGTGGVIVTGPSGEIAWSFNTPGMYRGSAAAGGERTVAIYGDER
ncbi:isoaspartyl peptidase/L-asparaginase [Sphingomonas sp. BGYR3]|uniref:isoaspartyl peptidase/L-asparaginase family protein n=1 Tax=Sphingomonas sp. BGYR3 TaxID=2975483 RepID=UPI0021A6167D|nr:isoaspartyl peptidase/L-asparaginase [Sphingomonas sp. BGYR3]MDG5488742.1 isoaspartyl peptidase/L-asparaginase [Sphingomonas sp. BGYR3]